MLSPMAQANSVFVEIVTSFGPVIFELYPKKAPRTVKNFLSYVDEGYYDGLIFHRIIDGFMIQGGGFDEDMNKKKTKAPIKNESNNRLSNVVGTIAMARTNAPHSATAQFYINVANNMFLNYKSAENPGYCVFGRVKKGMNIVNKIKRVEVSSKGPYQNVPVEPVIIKRIRQITTKEIEGEERKEGKRPKQLLPTTE